MRVIGLTSTVSMSTVFLRMHLKIVRLLAKLQSIKITFFVRSPKLESPLIMMMLLQAHYDWYQLVRHLTR